MIYRNLYGVIPVEGDEMGVSEVIEFCRRGGIDGEWLTVGAADRIKCGIGEGSDLVLSYVYIEGDNDDNL